MAAVNISRCCFININASVYITIACVSSNLEKENICYKYQQKSPQELVYCSRSCEMLLLQTIFQKILFDWKFLSLQFTLFFSCKSYSPPKYFFKSFVFPQKISHLIKLHILFLRITLQRRRKYFLFLNLKIKPR